MRHAGWNRTPRSDRWLWNGHVAHELSRRPRSTLSWTATHHLGGAGGIQRAAEVHLTLASDMRDLVSANVVWLV